MQYHNADGRIVSLLRLSTRLKRMRALDVTEGAVNLL